MVEAKTETKLPELPEKIICEDCNGDAILQDSEETDPGFVRGEYDCPKCNAIFTLETDDVGKIEYHVNCRICGKEIGTAVTKDLPGDIKEIRDIYTHDWCACDECYIQETVDRIKGTSDEDVGEPTDDAEKEEEASE